MPYWQAAQAIDLAIEPLAVGLGGSGGLPARFRAGPEPENFQPNLSRFDGSFYRRKRF